jgi:hypothetical protein
LTPIRLLILTLGYTRASAAREWNAVRYWDSENTDAITHDKSSRAVSRGRISGGSASLGVRAY